MTTPLKIFKILVATQNRHKTREVAQILGSRFRLFSLKEVKNVPSIVESGKSFDANARIKARALKTFLLQRKEPLDIDFVIADDSGLAVAALGGRPGVTSARYAGPKADDVKNRRKLLLEMHNKKDRRASFRCTIALAALKGRGKLLFFRGIVNGRISEMERGSNGFGYDPVFVPAGYKKTFGELSVGTKNRLSHRARALEKLRKWFIASPVKRRINLSRSDARILS